MKYYAVVYEGPTGEGGNWGAYVPDLPGLAVTGASRAECEALMAEGIPFHIEGLILNGDPVPPPTSEVGYLPAPSLQFAT